MEERFEFLADALCLVLQKISRFLLCPFFKRKAWTRKMNQPPSSSPANRGSTTEGGHVATGENVFVMSGMAAIELEHANYLKTSSGSTACIAVPTDAYETLLRATFRRFPLLTLAGKDGSDKSVIPVRFDTAKQVFFASDPSDGRLLVPLSIVCRQINQRKQEGTPFGAVTNIGAELMRQIDAAGHDGGSGCGSGGKLEPKLFEYDESGKYTGACINGQFVPAAKVNQDGLCLVCRAQATKRCAKCKMACYCSTACQSADWALHKTICGRLCSTKGGDFVVGTRVEPDPVEIQNLVTEIQRVRQQLAEMLKQKN